MKWAVKGFTLFEMLIVISIVGILAGLGFTSLESLRRSNLLRESQFKVGGDLERVRQYARRFGVRYLVNINETTGAYGMRPVNLAGVDIADYPRIQGQLNSNAEFVVAGNDSFFITGPFGKLIGNALCVAVSLKNTPLVAEIHLVGVTANVIKRAVKEGGGCV